MRTRVALAATLALVLASALPAQAAPGASDINKAGFDTSVPPPRQLP